MGSVILTVEPKQNIVVVKVVPSTLVTSSVSPTFKSSMFEQIAHQNQLSKGCC
jgi:hypothetical protein